MHKIMVVEDNDITRNYLASLIGGTKGFEVVAACRSAEEALACLATVHPDCILLDIKLPGMSGLDFIVESRNRGLSSEIVMLTMHEDRKHLLTALKNGASGYILKGSDSMDIIRALQDVIQGGAPMSPSIARFLVEEFTNRRSAAVESLLTPRETEVLQGIARGWPERKLAATLTLSSHTIHSHIKNIYRKLQVTSKLEAVTVAKGKGILS